MNMTCSQRSSRYTSRFTLHSAYVHCKCKCIFWTEVTHFLSKVTWKIKFVFILKTSFYLLLNNSEKKVQFYTRSSVLNIHYSTTQYTVISSYSKFFCYFARNGAMVFTKTSKRIQYYMATVANLSPYFLFVWQRSFREKHYQLFPILSRFNMLLQSIVTSKMYFWIYY